MDGDQRMDAQPDTDERTTHPDPDATSSANRHGDQPPPPKRRRKVVPFLIIGIVVIAGGIGGFVYWQHARHFETTDDAFIDGHLSQIGSQISGRVTRLLVNDNQRVAAGDVLVEIDPRDSQVKLDQARAQRANSAAQIDQMQAMVDVQKASLDQAIANVAVTEADLTQAEQDFARYRAVNPQAITRQQVDTASATLRSARAKLDANRQAVAGARAQIASAQAQLEAARASLQQGDANVASAELQLSYTKVRAEAAGRVTKRSVEVGNYVSPGQALMSIVPDDRWVTANFKETQLADMRVGQPVDIEVDSFPGVTFRGHVDSFQSGTGSIFSSLPAENATGNYVKVVQRLPVKIVFDGPVPDLDRLAPGLSVGPRVRVR